jgi:hypothetical protein
MAKKIAWTDQARADVRAIDATLPSISCMASPAFL